MRNWTHFALLLVDVQYDFWTEELADTFPHFPSQITSLLTFCRTEEIDIVHLHSRFKADKSDWMPRYKLRGRTPCVEGTIGSEPLLFALPTGDEVVITKQTFDGFLSPTLLPALQDKHFILVAGLITSTCILFTATAAAQRGFLTAIIDDCCADDPFIHEHTLDYHRFAFERTSLPQMPDRHAKWMQQLEMLE